MLLKKLPVLICILFFQSIWAQVTVSGTIVDSDGIPMVGANVLEKGTNNGTQSDFDGNYSINVARGATLVFSFVGFEKQEKEINGQNTINVTMVEDAAALDEVIVTALGISKDKKRVGYAVESVSSSSLEKSAETNIVNALNGKVSGVNITNASGDVGSSSNIVIRGTSSINSNNQALFVVDGVPIDNSTRVASDGQVYGSNRAGDIDFNNVESISVLKGGSATVLYGERGANGVILITTKKGKQNNRLNVDMYSSYSFETPNRYPKFQDKYARGRNGSYSNVTHWSWGPSYASNPRFPAGTLVDLDGDGVKEDEGGNLIPFNDDNWENFFKTGNTSVNSISLSGANDKARFYTSYTRTDQNGIVPNSENVRNSALLNASYDINDKINVGGSANFIQTKRQVAAAGINGWGDGLGYYHHMWDIDTRAWKDDLGNKTWFSGGVPDPLWVVNEENENSKVNRLLGNLNFSYEISKWFNFSYKIGLDNYSDVRKRYRPLSSVNTEGPGNGDGYVYTINSTILNSDIYFTGSGDLTEKIGIDYLVGNNIYDSKLDELEVTGKGQILSDFYDITNYNRVVATTSNQENVRIFGLFGEVTFDYDDTVYLGLTARNDWSSTLPENNRSYFYPSVNTSFIFSNLTDASWLTFGKLRGSLAQTGKSADPYQLYDVFVKDEENIGGQPRFTTSDLARNPNLKPEISTEWEVGAEMRMFDSKVSFDVTYYDKSSVNQIVRVPISYTSGFSEKVINSGEIRNKGIEALFSINDLVDLGDFKWGFDFNFTKNKNSVESLAEGFGDRVIIKNGWWSSTSKIAQIGYSTGTIIGIGYERDENGNIYVDDEGKPLLTEEKIILGDTNPDWVTNLTGRFNYKGFGLNFLFEFKKGGDIINDSEGWWVYSGLSKTTENRYYPSDPHANSTKVIKGIVKSTGEPNTTPINLDNSYYHDKVSFNDEELVEDASWIRLRNVSLTYNVPGKFLEKTGLYSVQLGFIGKNLWLSTDYNGKDPEVSSYGAGNSTGWDINGAPATKSYAFNIKIGL